MNKRIKIIIGIVAGFIAGNIINILIVIISGEVVPLPEGVDPSDIESLKQNIDKFEPRHFLMPFIAHSAGTILATFVSIKIIKAHQLKIAIAFGSLFLIGGIMNVVMLPTPTWFIILDLSCAYIPMGLLGKKLAS